MLHFLSLSVNVSSHTIWRERSIKCHFQYSSCYEGSEKTHQKNCDIPLFCVIIMCKNSPETKMPRTNHFYNQFQKDGLTICDFFLRNVTMSAIGWKRQSRSNNGICVVVFASAERHGIYGICLQHNVLILFYNLDQNFVNQSMVLSSEGWF